MAQWVENLPAVQEMQEMRVRSLGWEDPLKEGMASPSSILAWRRLWTAGPAELQPRVSHRVRLQGLSTQSLGDTKVLCH